MLRKLLTALAVVALLAAPAAADVYDNFVEYQLGSITLVSPAQGGSPFAITLDVAPNPKGVVGWGIDFVYGEDPTGSASWASDIRMKISSPLGEIVDVGGFSSVVNDWDFQGGGSTDPGFYVDDPIDGADNSNNFFKDDPQPKGQWVVTFENDWDSTAAAVITMDNVNFRLFKAVPEPSSLGLLAVAGLGLTILRRRTR